MPRILMLTGLGVAVALAVLWAMGGFADLLAWAAGQQQAVQTALAGAVRALRRGDPGAWGLLLGVAFSYGFFHAVGPGHGKALIGGYGIARRVPLGRLIGLALASSLAQAAFAVALVYAGVLVFDWSRPQLEGIADATFAPLSYAMVAGLGLWLVWRGARGLEPRPRTARQHHPHAPHDHGHDHQGSDCACGHAHAPTADEVAQVATLRDATLLVAAIAMRPCSGALFLLVLTFAMGIGWAGVAGAFAMGLGTASVTVLVAGLAVWAREGAFAALPGAGLARALPWVELLAGAVIAALSGLFLIQAV